MEEINVKVSDTEALQSEPDIDPSAINEDKPPEKVHSDGNTSAILFPESPVYEPEDTDTMDQNIITISDEINTQAMSEKGEETIQAKRKLSNESEDNNTKILKLDTQDFKESSQMLDDEVSKITSATKRKLPEDLVLPSTSRVRTPVKGSPRKVTKRSNSTDLPKTPKTPKTPKSRPASVDITRQRKTPKKVNSDLFKEKNSEEIHIISSDSSNSRPSVEFVKETRAPKEGFCDTIAEENASELNDSQNFHLNFDDDENDSNPILNDKIDDQSKPKVNYNSDPVTVKNRKEVLDPGKTNVTRSEGYNYSDQSSNLSQHIQQKNTEKDKATDQESIDSISSIIDNPRKKVPNPDKTNVTRSEGYNYSDQNTIGKDKATDQESTDSMCSIIDSPDPIPTVTSKLISKLSNGNSSTPTEQAIQNKHLISDNDSDATPDMLKLNGKKGKRGKNESFKMSNTTTPSTISPLQNGHSLPMNTPHIPTFDVHVSHNEDGEFLSLYIVKTDNDLGMDMYKEYQRFSKRFTIDPYMADVSASNSPSSVTSTGMVNLQNRTSFASTTTSTSTASNRTSDGAFVVPQAPRKSVSHPASCTVKGCDALIKKIQDIFSHIREFSPDAGNRSGNDEKVSVGIQASPSSEASLSNGNASPQEVGKCDKVTPKSSLKKSRVRGRRPLSGKTKRAILPTQTEEPEYMAGINSPEMVPSNSENGKMSPKFNKDDKPLSTLVATPKSVGKLKQKSRRPTSPRPATPVEKTVVKQEYPGYSPDTVVLAKWVDKRYYSGKVIEITEPNKYLIKFDDGQSKALLDDFIIFGDKKALPLQGQSVYAMVDEEQNYEPGLVLGVDENNSGTVTYRCTTDGDTTVSVTASELYLTEDQARSIKETARPRSPNSAPTTPRRRGLRELDLDNIIQGPRSARTRDKGSSSARKRVTSPKSPKASTSGVNKAKSTPVISRKRLASESSEMSESSNSAPPVRLEEVAGVEPEVQKTPRKIDGVKAGPLQLKGASKQNVGKKNSKLMKWNNDSDTISQLGPIPPAGSQLFAGLHFLLTCTEPPTHSNTQNDKFQETRHYSSEEDGETTSSMVGTDTEDLVFSDKPFNKERLKEQIEAGAGIVYSHFDDVPRNKYSSTRLIAPRPCLTAKYIQCLAADVRAVSHGWLIASCQEGALSDAGRFALPAGWGVLGERFIDWVPPSGKRNTSFFKDKLILLCGDQDTFVKFWERVCTLAGANTRVVNEEDLNMSGAVACVTEWDCPHEVQNKANQDNIPLVSTTWVVQCLIEARMLLPTSHDKFSFMYTEPE